MLKKSLLVLAFASAVAPAWAANVLFLTTQETRSNGVRLVDSAWTGIDAATTAAGDTLTDRRNTLSGAGSLDAAALAAADVVVVMTVYEPADPSKMDAITAMMKSNPNKTFVVFTDGCCSRPDNIDKFVAAMNDATGWGISLTNHAGLISSALNTNSPFSGDFTNLDPLEGADYGILHNVPGENALYMDAGVALPAPTARTAAYGFFVPQAAMNGGNGACTFLMADTSPFYLPAIGTVQGPVIMGDFLKAAKDAAGSCKKASAVADLKPVITGPASTFPGGQVNLQINVNNLGAGPSTDGTLTLTLPPGVRTTGTLPSGCVLAPGATDTTPEVLTCTLAGLAASGSTSLNVPVQVKDPGSFVVSAVISAVTGENITTNNSATHTIAAAATPVGVAPMPVPVDSWPMLGALAGLLGALTWRRQKRESRRD